MEFLKKLLIKDYKNTQKPEVRFRYGKACGIIGIVSNALLFAFKIAVGLISMSVAVIADAFNNLSDAGSSVATVLGFKLSARPADKEHPFGHARYEYITALIVSFIVVQAGLLLAIESVKKIIEPGVVNVSAITYIVLGFALVMKFFQMLVYRNFGKSINSGALTASATDSRNDMISTTAVIIASIVTDTTGINIDGYAGLAVSLFIIISGIKLIKDTINPLLGTRPDKEYVEKIKSSIMAYDKILGVHDLAVHSYGAGETFVICHAEVSASEDFLECHDLIDSIERELEADMGIRITIHMDPIENDNAEVNSLRERVLSAVKTLDNTLDIHDFRVVFGKTHTNILFDAVIPFESKITKEEIVDAARKALSSDGVAYFFIIEADRL